MSSINSVSATTSNTHLPAVDGQIADLQRQCADWRSCPTTPPAEKEKLIAALESQIQALKNGAEQHKQVESSSSVADARLDQPSTVPPSDGVNRPSNDPFALSGSVLNTSI